MRADPYSLVATPDLSNVFYVSDFDASKTTADVRSWFPVRVQVHWIDDTTALVVCDEAFCDRVPLGRMEFCEIRKYEDVKCT